jgi:hypothetical protein
MEELEMTSLREVKKLIDLSVIKGIKLLISIH